VSLAKCGYFCHHYSEIAPKNSFEAIGNRRSEFYFYDIVRRGLCCCGCSKFSRQSQNSVFLMLLQKRDTPKCAPRETGQLLACRQWISGRHFDEIIGCNWSVPTLRLPALWNNAALHRSTGYKLFLNTSTFPSFILSKYLSLIHRRQVKSCPVSLGTHFGVSRSCKSIRKTLFGL
jgi:hypothetical protein